MDNKSDKILILPDIHLSHKKAEKIISSVKADKIVALGDFFDNFDDTPEMVFATAEWFKDFINRPNVVACCGNHDIMYWFKDNKNVRCGGYTDEKSKIINSIVKPDDWNKLKFYHVIDDWILSHAGIHPFWIDMVKFRKNEPVEITQEALIQKLETDSKECIKRLNKGDGNWFIVAGFSRSNSPFVGGLLWCDFNQEFEPIRGIHQILGHTPDRENIRWSFLKEGSTIPEASIHGAEPYLSKQSSYNVCIDSYPALKWYAILEDKKLTIHETEKL